MSLAWKLAKSTVSGPGLHSSLAAARIRLARAAWLGLVFSRSARAEAPFRYTTTGAFVAAGAESSACAAADSASVEAARAVVARVTSVRMMGASSVDDGLGLIRYQRAAR